MNKRDKSAAPAVREDVGQSEIRRRLALFERAEALAHSGHFEWDTGKRRMRYCSPACAALFDASAERLLEAEGWFGLLGKIDAGDRADFETMFLRPAEAVSPELDFRLAGSDGRIYRLRLSIEKSSESDHILFGNLRRLETWVEPEAESEFGWDAALQAERLANIGYYFYDETRDRFLYASPVCARIYGLSNEAFMNAHQSTEASLEMVHEDDRKLVFSAFYDYYDNGGESSFEYRVLRPHGEVRWVREHIAAMRLQANGKVALSRGILQDITQYKIIEKELEQAVSIARLGHWSYDEPNDRFLSVSPEFVRIFGLSVEEFMANHYSVERMLPLVHPDDREILAGTYDADRDRDFDYRVFHRNGGIRFVHESYRCIRDRAGHVRETVGTLQDVTEIKQAQLRAEASNEAKSRFLSTMSHELNTPLNTILGYGELLDEELNVDGPHQLKPDLDRVLQAGRHLREMVASVLEVSSIDSNEMGLGEDSFELSGLIDEVAAGIQPSMRHNDNRFELPAIGNSVGLVGDRSKVVNILSRLLNNASRFSPGGRVSLQYSLEGKWIEFRVEDDGIGISEHDLDKVFDAFRQVDSSYSRSFDGAGLGLTVCKMFCESMGGSISVESEPGAGSTFTLRLPIVRT